MGKRIVYFSEHPAVALLENLVNLQFTPAAWPDSYLLIRAEADAKDFAPQAPST